MIRSISVLALTSMMAFAAPAFAQDASLSPNFGSRTLSAGFTPDPLTVDLVAGGTINASSVGGSCVGNIADAPDFRVTYSAGSFPLVFRTRSGADTTLVINGPDGRWSCDDDSFGDGDAEVRFNTPGSGVYDIWVGTFGSDSAEAVLIVTETP